MRIRRIAAVLLAAAILCALAVVLLRGRAETAPAAAEAAPALTAAPAQPSAPPALSTALPAESEEPVSQPLRLQRELIRAAALGKDTGSLLQQLAAADPRLSGAWVHLLYYWNQTEAEDFVRTDGTLPGDLPQDDSLCLIALGYALRNDGTMSPELLGRLELLLACARQYPNAWILVTGGHTAADAPEVSEAGAMAQWLLDNGIAAERLLIEDQSLTSAENAVFSCRLLRESCPQVQQAAIISSDYHVPMGCLLFETQFSLERAGGDIGAPAVAAGTAFLSPLSYDFDRLSVGASLLTLLQARSR